MEQSLKIRVLSQTKGSRYITTTYHEVKDRLEAYALGEALSANRGSIVDLIDDKGLILKRFSLWAI